MEELGLGPLLREAVRTGSIDAIGVRLAEDAVLDTSSERGRRHVRGRDAIVEHLNRAGAGEVIELRPLAASAP